MSEPGAALFGVGRPDLAVGLTGVALCHDVLILGAAPVLRPRAGWQLGLTGLAAVLAAHVGLTFKIVFAGHAGSMHSPGNGSQFACAWFGCEGVHTNAAFCSARSPARSGASNFRRTI